MSEYKENAKAAAIVLPILTLIFGSIFWLVPAKADPVRCWVKSPELGTEDEVVRYLNNMNYVPDKIFFLHTYRGGIKWHFIYVAECYK